MTLIEAKSKLMEIHYTFAREVSNSEGIADAKWLDDKKRELSECGDLIDSLNGIPYFIETYEGH